MTTLSKTTGIATLVLLGALVSGSAMADRDGHRDRDGYRDRGDHHGYDRGYRHDRDDHDGGRVRFGISLGVPLYAPGYYAPDDDFPYPAYAYPAYAYPPVVVRSAPAVVVRAAPPVYIEQNTAQAAPAPAYWYYCAASNGYYPYVSECPAGWQRVPAQPPAR